MDNKPTPIRLKDLKIPLQEEALKIDRSLNWLVCSILKEHHLVKNYLKSKEKAHLKNKQA